MQGRGAGSQRDNWDKPAKGDNPDRKNLGPPRKRGLSTWPATSSLKNIFAKGSRQLSRKPRLYMSCSAY